jgi:hypothetical protein
MPLKPSAIKRTIISLGQSNPLPGIHVPSTSSTRKFDIRVLAPVEKLSFLWERVCGILGPSSECRGREMQKITAQIKNIMSSKGMSIVVSESMFEAQAGQGQLERLPPKINESIRRNMLASANGDDLEDGFQIQADFSESEENIEAVIVQELTGKKKRKRNTGSKEKAVKVSSIRRWY